MIRDIIHLLKMSNSDNKYIRIAKGRNKYPENFSELKNYWKLYKIKDK